MNPIIQICLDLKRSRCTQPRPFSKKMLRLPRQKILCTLGLSFTSPTILNSMSELTLLPGNTVECAWCKDPKPMTETTWFMPEPGERSVRLCSFCYEEARKQVRLLRFVRTRGEFPVEAAS